MLHWKNLLEEIGLCDKIKDIHCCASTCTFIIIIYESKTSKESV